MYTRFGVRLFYNDVSRVCLKPKELGGPLGQFLALIPSFLGVGGEGG